MINTHNPYAPPSSFDANMPAWETAKGIWREGEDLVIVQDVPLPSRCVKCNAPGAPRSKPLKLWWHPSGYYLLIFLSPLIYIIAALIARKNAKVSPALCEEHMRSRTKIIRISWFGAIVCLVMWLLPLGSDEFWSSLLAFFSAVGFIIFGIFKSRIVYARRIDDLNVRMGGCGEDFLDSLPRHPG